MEEIAGSVRQVFLPGTDAVIRGKGKMKVGTCDDCMHWDNSLESILKESIKQYQAELTEVFPGYWDQWDKAIYPALPVAEQKTEERAPPVHGKACELRSWP